MKQALERHDPVRRNGIAGHAPTDCPGNTVPAFHGASDRTEMRQTLAAGSGRVGGVWDGENRQLENLPHHVRGSDHRFHEVAVRQSAECCTSRLAMFYQVAAVSWQRDWHTTVEQPWPMP